MSASTCENLVLVVDDDADIRESIAEVLEDNGFRSLAAANGREALEQLRASPTKPCAILLDIMMPVMDGWQFRAAQQQDPELSSIPVVVVSAHANLEEAIEKMQVAATLKKPVQLEVLIEVVSRFCRPLVP